MSQHTRTRHVAERLSDLVELTVRVSVGLGLVTLLSTVALAQSPTPRGPILKTQLGEVEIFPADNPWNQDVSKLKVHVRSKAWVDSIGADKPLFPCFGADYQGAPNGIPYVVVEADAPKQFITFEYPDESEKGPYPIPKIPPIEGGPKAPQDSDRHVLMIDAHNKKLYELFHVLPDGPGKWKAGSGAIFDLTSNKLRTLGWTSADAAGLPIFPGLVRYDEAVAVCWMTDRKSRRCRLSISLAHPAAHETARTISCSERRSSAHAGRCPAEPSGHLRLAGSLGLDTDPSRSRRGTRIGRTASERLLRRRHTGCRSEHLDSPHRSKQTAACPRRLNRPTLSTANALSALRHPDSTDCPPEKSRLHQASS